MKVSKNLAFYGQVGDLPQKNGIVVFDRLIDLETVSINRLLLTLKMLTFVDFINCECYDGLIGNYEGRCDVDCECFSCKIDEFGEWWGWTCDGIPYFEWRVDKSQFVNVLFKKGVEDIRYFLIPKN